MPLHYTPASSAGWLTLVHEPRLLAVSAADADFISAAWPALANAAGFQLVLDLLTRKGLAATPSFVLIEWASGESARVIVRGDATVTVGEQVFTGGTVSTWVESTVTDVSSVSITIPGAVGSEVRLPLELGAAFAAAIEVTSAGASASPKPVAVAASPGTAKLGRIPVGAPKPTAAPPAAPPVDVEATIVVELPAVAETSDTTDGSRAAPSSTSGTGVASGAGVTDYDYLFGETQHRSVAEAAVREPDEEPEHEPAPELPGDHDGQTVLTSDIAKLRRKRQKSEAPDAPPEPKLVLVLPSGSREPLTQPILVGRAPSVSQVSPGQLPRLLTIGSIDQDISRNHAQFALAGDTVVVTDLHSKNGTTISLPGKEPQKLRAGEPTSVLVGTTIDLGGGVTFTVEDDGTAGVDA